MNFRIINSVLFFSIFVLINCGPIEFKDDKKKPKKNYLKIDYDKDRLIKEIINNNENINIEALAEKDKNELENIFNNQQENKKIEYINKFLKKYPQYKNRISELKELNLKDLTDKLINLAKKTNLINRLVENYDYKKEEIKDKSYDELINILQEEIKLTGPEREKRNIIQKIIKEHNYDKSKLESLDLKDLLEYDDLLTKLNDIYNVPKDKLKNKTLKELKNILDEQDIKQKDIDYILSNFPKKYKEEDLKLKTSEELKTIIEKEDALKEKEQIKQAAKIGDIKYFDIYNTSKAAIYDDELPNVKDPQEININNLKLNKDILLQNPKIELDIDENKSFSELVTSVNDQAKELFNLYYDSYSLLYPGENPDFVEFEDDPEYSGSTNYRKIKLTRLKAIFNNQIAGKNMHDIIRSIIASSKVLYTETKKKELITKFNSVFSTLIKEINEAITKNDIKERNKLKNLIQGKISTLAPMIKHCHQRANEVLGQLLPASSSKTLAEIFSAKILKYIFDLKVQAYESTCTELWNELYANYQQLRRFMHLKLFDKMHFYARIAYEVYDTVRVPGQEIKKNDINRDVYGGYQWLEARDLKNMFLDKFFKKFNIQKIMESFNKDINMKNNKTIKYNDIIKWFKKHGNISPNKLVALDEDFMPLPGDIYDNNYIKSALLNIGILKK